MPLHPQVQRLIEQSAGLDAPPLREMPIEQARRASCAAMPLAGEPEPIAHVENRLVATPAGNIGIRIYRPDAGGTLPAFVFFHGGGWIRGDLDTHDVPCRAIANRASCVVISVDYRLAPESPFPAAVHDAYAATEWVERHSSEVGVDSSKIAIGGDSAGGTLATVVCSLAKARGGPKLAFQSLIYPCTDATMSCPSFKEFATGYRLTADSMAFCYESYVPQIVDRKAPLVSPLFTRDLSGLPPAFVATCEYDVLRDEGERYAGRLQEAGVQTELKRYEGMVHGFLLFGAQVNSAHELIGDVCRTLREGLKRVGSERNYTGSASCLSD